MGIENSGYSQKEISDYNQYANPWQHAQVENMCAQARMEPKEMDSRDFGQRLVNELASAVGKPEVSAMDGVYGPTNYDLLNQRKEVVGRLEFANDGVNGPHNFKYTDANGKSTVVDIVHGAGKIEAIIVNGRSLDLKDKTPQQIIDEAVTGLTGKVPHGKWDK